MANGTLGLLDSISWSTISRDSNLYDLFMPATRPSRTTCSTQSCDLSGGSPVKWSPLNFFFDFTTSPSMGFIQ